MISTHRCLICQKDFTAERKGGRPPNYCSDECKAERARLAAKKWHVENADRAEAYRKANAGRINEYNRQYYAKDRAKHIARAVAWQAANPEAWEAIRLHQKESGADRQRARKWREENPELFKERQRAYYWGNPEAGRERARQWAKDNPEKARALNRRNNARRKAAIRGATDLDPLEPVVIFDRDGWICGICLEPIDPTLSWPNRHSASIDHIIPIASGGQHVAENVQAAHLTCNSSKGNRVAT